MSLIHRLRDWSRRRELRARLEEELSFHFDQLAFEYERRGYAPDEARRRARRELGNTTLVHEVHRERTGLPWIEEWTRDAWLALRGLCRRPGYAGTVVGLLAVGLAATLTIFVLTDAMLLRALAVPRAHELHLIQDAQGEPGRFSRATVDRLREALPTGRVVAHGGDTPVTVQRGAAPAQRARGQLVAGDALANLEVRAAAGRVLTPGDDRIGAGLPVAVAAHGWAVREFGSAEAALGSEITMNRQRLQIVGVLEPDFVGFDAIDRVDLFMPTALQPLLAIQGNSRIFGGSDRPNDPDWNRENRARWLQVSVRVPADHAPELARTALLAAVQPDREDMLSQLQSPVEREAVNRETWEVVSAPGGFSYDRRAFADTSRMLLALVGSLLLLTCANLSGIMLVRTLSRHREIGVRLSLGAGAWRACRLAVVEALWCGVLGAMGGLLLATWLLPAAAALLAPGAMLQLEVTGARQMGALAVAALGSSLACALAPAWWISRLEPLVASKGLMAGGRLPQRLGRALVALQLALAVMLAAVATSLAGEIGAVLDRDPGFAREEVLTARFDPRSAGYEPETLPGLYTRLREAALSVPGVERVGMSSNGILSGSRSRSGVFPRGEGLEARAGDFQQDTTDTHYLETVGLRLQQGRWFEHTDQAGSPPVAVVSEAFARAMWGEIEVLGRRFGYDYTASDEDMTVIGIVADAGINRAREQAPAVFFTPEPQAQGRAVFGFMAVRVHGEAAAVRRSLAAALSSVEPGLVFGGWQTLGERRADSLGGEIASSRLAAVVAGFALALAGFGVGGALAHIVALRQRELAVRAALGATPARLRDDVLRDSLRLGLWGAAGGAALMGLVAMGMPAVGWWPATPAAAVAGLLAALVGGWWPAQRAAQVNLLQMLKAD